MRDSIRLLISMAAALFPVASGSPAVARGGAPQSRQVLSNGVHLQLLDYGGSGPAMVLLAGMNDTAYIWGDFAPRFTARYHVYALTRRGHGQSDKPAAGYDTDMLTRDLLGAMDALHIARATIIGHSMAGDELTRFAGLYPDRVDRLVYLDAAYDRARLPELVAKDPAGEPRPEAADLASFAAFTAWYRRTLGFWSPAFARNLEETYAGPNGSVRPVMSRAAGAALYEAMISFRPNYAADRAPALALYAVQIKPALPDSATLEQRAAAHAYLNRTYAPWQREQARRFAAETLCGESALLAGADHYLFIERLEDVAARVNRFLRTPPTCRTDGQRASSRS